MIPSGRHNDWPFPFSFIPRRWTAFNSDHEPRRLVGTATGHLDIPPRGTWVLAWYPYLAVTTKGGWHFRTGLRYDYSDKYYEVVPVTLKRLK